MPLTKQRASLRDDAYLEPFRDVLERRASRVTEFTQRLTGADQSLADFASGHTFFGLHRDDAGWVMREYAPNATALYLVGEFSGWETRDAFAFQREGPVGCWALRVPADVLRHEMQYRLKMQWDADTGDRIPSYARRVVQDWQTGIFSAQVWCPDQPYRWQHDGSARNAAAPLIYEAHVGMAQERDGVGTYDEFREHVLPRIAAGGYNTVQLMAIAEHPYYGSFGYQVANFFAVSSRCGTPDEFKHLVDAAHGLGLSVIMDVVHSHAVANEVEGLSRFDGTPYQFFHDGPRGYHPAWGSRCFDYGKPEVLHFLLSNCRFWLDEYHIDGFRFDGVTSMLYHHHGLGPGFGSYEAYFGGDVDEDAVTYLALANRVVHAVRPDAITIAEDVSGLPGLAAPADDGGCGFDYRLAMGVTDMWYKLIRDTPDDDWHMEGLWHELTNRRADERTISYAECHDQALVGGKTLIFQLADAAMYDAMHVSQQSMVVSRAIALHKIIRLLTLVSAGDGYLNFMGNEFGHPEWIDFPREGNAWSCHYARRQWSLRDNPELRYHALGVFDVALLELFRDADLLDIAQPERVFVHNDDKLLVVARGDFYVLCNLHPTQSFTDYPIPMPAGRYQLVLDTDEARFDGFSRIAEGQVFESAREVTATGAASGIRVYLPSRVAMIIKREACDE